MDYYRLLGVSKTSSSEDIKRAYRKLAMKHHPDRGGDAETLQKINEAYDTLKNPAKRQQYDNPQPQMNSRHAQGDPNDFFNNMFNQFTNQRRYSPKNRDIHISANIELRDILYGRLLIFEYRLQSGKKERVEIEVPRGVQENQMVRYPNLGDDGNSNIQRGDLIVKFVTHNTQKWRRDGQNLHTTVDISAIDAILGTEIELETIETKRLGIKIPAGTHPETVMNIAEHGLPYMNSNRRGNIFVKIKIKTPKINDPTILDKLKEINDEITRSA